MITIPCIFFFLIPMYLKLELWLKFKSRVTFLKNRKSYIPAISDNWIKQATFNSKQTHTHTQNLKIRFWKHWFLIINVRERKSQNITNKNNSRKRRDDIKPTSGMLSTAWASCCHACIGTGDKVSGPCKPNEISCIKLGAWKIFPGLWKWI